LLSNAPKCDAAAPEFPPHRSIVLASFSNRVIRCHPRRRAGLPPADRALYKLASTREIVRSRTLHGGVLPTGRAAAAALLTAGGMCISVPATSAVDLSAGATIGVEHNTNAFELSNIEPTPLAADGTTARSDTSKHLTANVAALIGAEGPVRISVDAMFRRVESEFGTLEHNDYTFAGGIDWRPGEVFDVSLEATQNRLPLGLADVGGTQSTLQRTREAQATLRVRPVPSWQIGLSPGWSEVSTPLPDAQGFKLKETRGSASLGFIGAGPLVPGIVFERTEGKNSGIENATNYKERTIQGTLNYAATELSTFSLAAGHTRRSTTLAGVTVDPDAAALDGSDSAFTGALNFSRQLSVKTGISLTAYRSFDQYDAGVNTSVGTGFNFGVVWEPTVKTSVSLESGLVWSTIEGLTDAGSDGEREDLVRNYALGLTYQATQRLSVRAHYTRRIRRSEVWADQFNNSLVGLELTAAID